MVAIAVLDDYQNVAMQMADWSKLEANHRITVVNEPLADIEAAKRVLIGHDVVCLMRERTPLPRQLIEQLPMLRLILTGGMRNAAIDMAAAAERGILVCGTKAGNHATAELAVGLMLALGRNLVHEAQAVREGRWQTTVGSELRGKTLGLLGLGKLGGAVAKLGRAFGMRVIAWSENLTPQAAYEHGAERVEKDELFARADYLSIHTRLSQRTRGIVGARELGLMKPTAHLINTSRGPIVDEVALLAALDAGTLRGAGLDVFDVEPLPVAHRLRTHPRVVATPHLGYVTEETYRMFYPGMVTAIEGWLAGKPVNVIAP